MAAPQTAAPQMAAGQRPGSATAPLVLGETLTLTLGGAALNGQPCSTVATTLNGQSLVLVVNGQTIPGAGAVFECSAAGELLGSASTSIAGNDDAAQQRRTAWQNAFDGFFSLGKVVPVKAAFGPATGGISTAVQTVHVKGAGGRDLMAAAVWAVAIAALFIAGFLTRFGRDPMPKPVEGVPLPAGYSRPYSLSRFQLLWWSAIVIACYAGIVTVTGSMNTVTTGTMALMGIVGGTSVLAAFQDNRPSPDDDRRAAFITQYLAAAQASPPDSGAMKTALAEIYPSSQGWLSDLVSDAHGYSIHRFQLLVWTIVLGLTFLYEVTRTLGMPELSTELLALTGISNGTYFGFKVQEQQVATPPQGAAAGGT
ncbi:hypothetical protein [Azospirillum thermophilum]|nr:hypothetical protein [Azospirillum thermophilum]